MGEPFLETQRVHMEDAEERTNKISPKDVGRENDTRPEYKTSNRSPSSLEVHPVCFGVGDAIALSLETI